jgi:arsenate reductase-like glutaredoxin family protein
MFLAICVYDSSVDIFTEELNKSPKSFKSYMKLSTELSCTQIVRSIQIFSDTINRPIIYANRQVGCA